MKKLISFIFAIMFLFSTANADTVTDIVNRWNAYTNMFPAPRLDMEQYSDGSFAGDGWQVSFIEEYGDVNAIGILADDTDIVIPMCIVAGMAYPEKIDSNDLISSIGRLVYSYYKAKKGEEPSPSSFGLCRFQIVPIEGRFFFSLIGIK